MGQHRQLVHIFVNLLRTNHRALHCPGYDASGKFVTLFTASLVSSRFIFQKRNCLYQYFKQDKDLRCISRDYIFSLKTTVGFVTLFAASLVLSSRFSLIDVTVYRNFGRDRCISGGYILSLKHKNVYKHFVACRPLPSPLTVGCHYLLLQDGMLYTCGVFWFSIFIIPVIALLADFLYKL